ncbi:MAG TPA: FHA domain-containing protein [Ktedonobacteraceae bacterium]|nr:FHA domain-containing protein [Ktedonobacteraceae bacterium]
MTVKCSLGHENPDGSAFCDECGEPLSGAVSAPTAVASTPMAGAADTLTCPSCGATNAAGESFCSNCGAPLQGTPAPTVPTMAPVVEQAAAPAPAGLHARLLVEADNQEFDLSGKDNVMIGREDPASNIYPDIDLTPHGGEEGGVSRKHARIFVQNGQYMVEDQDSTNFTFVNRQRLAARTPTPINDNDELRLGRVLLRFKTT